jgi:uncharacterized membrane protein
LTETEIPERKTTVEPLAPDPAPDPAAASRDRRSSGFGGRLRAYFVAGVVVTAPISITLYLAWLLVDTVDGTIAQLFPAGWNPESYLPFAVPGLGLLVAVMALTLVGMLTANYLGRLVLRAGEATLARMPVIRSIYGASKQIFETVLADQSSAFREVVLFEYPRRGSWAIGFVMGAPDPQVSDAGGADMVTVFVPTTPNPTSGFLLFLPRAEAHPLSLTVEEGLKLVVSGGIVSPPESRALPPAPAPAPERLDA